MNKVTMRTEVHHYFNTATENAAETPQWTRCGDGWTQFQENPGANTEETKYINMSSSSSAVTDYSPNYNVAADLMLADPTIKMVHDIAKDRKTGSDALVDMLTVEVTGDGTACDAWRETAAVGITSFDGEKKMSLTGTLAVQGDPVKGKFNVKTKTFTPDSEE